MAADLKVQRIVPLGEDPVTAQPLTVYVGFMAGEPTVAFYVGDAIVPTCTLSIIQLGQIMGAFNELESTA